MSDIIVLTSNKKQDKRAAVLALQKKFKINGYKTAVLVTTNGRVDVYSYLLEQRYHYSIPLTAVKSKKTFEQWVPVGFDKYIFEVTFPFSPIGAAYIDIFRNINEVVSYDLRNSWREHVLDPRNRANSIDPSENINDLVATPDLTPIWNIIHDRNVQTLITKCPTSIEGPYLDLINSFHNEEQLAMESITPRMILPKSDKKIIVVGEFPAEYWDISSQLNWYKYNYAEFMEALRAEKYDFAVIGTCHSEKLKLRDKPKNHPVICYQPNVYLNLIDRVKSMSSVQDFQGIFSAIKNQSKDWIPSFDDKGPFSGYNNRFIVNTKHILAEAVWKEGNVIFCDGWIPPQYLIQENLLVVK